jgi:tetratricopeptide (TPR) repeat protein
MRFAWLVLSLWVVGIQPAEAEDSSSLSELFEAANIAASRGNHEAAVSRYQTLIDAGVRDADVFFNLGTVFAQAGDYPRAILSYERALLFRPGDERVVENLRRAEQALEEQRAEKEGEATIRRSSSIGDALYGRFTEDLLAYVLLLANAAFFLSLGWAWLSRRRGRWLIAATSTAGLVLALSALGLAVKAGMLRDGPRGVVLGERVALREGPDERARVREFGRGGDRAQVVNADGGFVKLKVAGGAQGWAPASSVGLIDMDERLH